MLVSKARSSSSALLVPVSKSLASCHCRLPPAVKNARAAPEQHNARDSRRHYATSSGRFSQSAGGRAGGVRIGTLFVALSILGIGATSLGLYNYYTSLKTFPPEIRKDLRGALRCKARQDYQTSHKFFQQAWDRIMEDPELERNLGILKITGIAIAWSEMLEEASRRADQGSVPDAASETYSALLQGYNWAKEQIARSAASVTNDERMRVVSMAVKLANLAEGEAHLDKQSEEQLTWAV